MKQKELYFCNNTHAREETSRFAEKRDGREEASNEKKIIFLLFRCPYRYCWRTSQSTEGDRELVFYFSFAFLLLLLLLLLLSDPHGTMIDIRAYERKKSAMYDMVSEGKYKVRFQWGA